MVLEDEEEEDEDDGRGVVVKFRDHWSLAAVMP